MGLLLETSISAFFLVGILAISFMFFWRARSVERKLGLLMKAALTNTRDLRHCSEVMESGFHTLGRAENHQRVLLASLNSQMSNLSQMLEAGSRPSQECEPVQERNAPAQRASGGTEIGSGAGKTSEKTSVTGSTGAESVRAGSTVSKSYEPVAKPVKLSPAEESIVALERLVAPAASRMLAQGLAASAAQAPAQATAPAAAANAYTAPAATAPATPAQPFAVVGGREAPIPGYRSVRNRTAERPARTGGSDAGLQRKIRTIEELFRKVELPLANAAGSAVRSRAEPEETAQAAVPAPRFADLLSYKRRVVNG